MTEHSATADDANEPRPAESQAAEPPTTGRGHPEARRKWLLLIGVLVLAAAIAFAIWELFLSPPSETTDDAYVAGDVVAVTARDPGTVIALYADDTERVLAGQPLIDLDPTSADVELEAAAAQLGQAVRGVRGHFSAVDSAQAQRVQARAELAQANANLARRQKAASEGAVSGEELAHAADAVKLAEAALVLAESRVAQAETQVQGASIRDNPAVLAAIANYHRAAIRRSHMQITAPVAGTLAKRNVQIGQQVGVGTPLMAVVPLERVWVDANFRETQLADMRLGQPVKLVSDIYGDKVEFHGRVVGLSAGSGSAFALLPPQNASGNWIKITQRLPVRIALDPRELAEHPLRIGLSVKVTVDTSDRSGSALGRIAEGALATSPALDLKVEADIARIIAANTGKPA